MEIPFDMPFSPFRISRFSLLPVQNGAQAAYRAQYNTLISKAQWFLWKI